jgi:oligopeptidase B
VRWLCTWDKPKALLVIVYGAYGMTTPVGTTRWRAYIEAGFAVGFAFVRGGGDDNDIWAEAGRREGKERGVEDFEACVRAMQRATGVGAEKTCIFGRSAGGYLIGTTVLRNPDGGLAKYVYAEAPYVDVLQTASNVDLPLTMPEYFEFGDPAHKIFDFETILRLSPVSGLGPDGAPGVFVLCRVGLNDRQVYAYESVKWMDALRGGRKEDNKILFLTEGVGHNVHGELESIERAEDFLILFEKMLGDTR